MRLIIPAAGAGIRLAGSTTNPFPKLLIPMHGRPIISHLLRIASSVGSFSDVVIILGPEYEKVTQTVRELSSGIKWQSKTTITLLKNPKYLETNNIYSLYLAREFLEGDVILHDSDVLVAPSAFAKFLPDLRGNEALALIDESKPIPMEETKIKTRQGQIVEFGEHIQSDEAEGRYVGVCRFTSATSSMLKEEIEGLIEQNDLKVYYTKAVNYIASHAILRPVWTEKAPWLEVDTWEDLKASGSVARQIIDSIKTPDHQIPAEVIVRDLDS
jgi:choline kinase